MSRTSMPRQTALSHARWAWLRCPTRQQKRHEEWLVYGAGPQGTAPGLAAAERDAGAPPPAQGAGVTLAGRTGGNVRRDTIEGDEECWTSPSWVSGHNHGRSTLLSNGGL